MNKKLKITSLTAAALASVALASANLNTEVKADTQTATDSVKANSAVENAQANVNSAQKEVNSAQEKVNNAKSSLDSATSAAISPNQAYSSQESAVSNAQADVNAKKDAVDSATEKQTHRQDLANEAKKPNAISDAKKAVTTKKADITQKQNDVVNTQKEVPAKAKAVSDAKSELSQKQEQLKQAQANEKQANSAVEAAEGDLKNTGVVEAQDRVDNDEQTIANLNKSIPENQKKVQADKNSLTQKQKDLDSTQKLLSDAQSKQKTAQYDFDNANKALQAAKNQLVQDQKLANSAAGFFKDLAEDASLTAKQREDAKYAYSIVMNKGDFWRDGVQDQKHLRLSWYDPNKQLGQDGDATSLERMKSALQDLRDLQTMRKQNGLPVPNVSLTATAIAMMSSDYLNSHNFGHPIENGPFWHDFENIIEGDNGQIRYYMSEKDLIDRAIENNPSLSNMNLDPHHITEQEWYTKSNFWKSQKDLGSTSYTDEEGIIHDAKGVNHYLSMIDPGQNSVGMARTDTHSSMDYLSAPTTPEGNKTKVVGVSNPYPSFTIEQYQNLVNSYNPETASFIQKDNQDIKNKEADVSSKQDKLNKVTATINSLSDSISKIKKDISGIQGQIETIQKSIQSQQSELAKAQKDLPQAKSHLEEA